MTENDENAESMDWTTLFPKTKYDHLLLEAILDLAETGDSEAKQALVNTYKQEFTDIVTANAKGDEALAYKMYRNMIGVVFETMEDNGVRNSLEIGIMAGVGEIIMWMTWEDE